MPGWKIQEYSSLSEFADAAENASKDRVQGSGDESENGPHRHTWTYGDDLPTFIDFMRHGWADGRDDLEEIATRALVAARTTLADQTYGCTDDPSEAIEPDLGLYTSGQPEYWIQCVDSPDGSIKVPERALRIGVRVAFHCGTDGSDMQSAIALGVGVALGVMAHGIPVMLDTVSSVQCGCYGNGGFVRTVRLMDHHTALSYDRLAVCTHPGYFRRADFAVSETKSDICTCLRSGGYGRPVALENVPASTTGKLAFDLVIEAGTGCDESTVIKMVNDAVEKARS
jgi:hypothetical protein